MHNNGLPELPILALALAMNGDSATGNKVPSKIVAVGIVTTESLIWLSKWV